MQIIGREYIAQHCMETLQERKKDEAWRAYVADSIWCSNNNRTMKKRWSELIRKDTEPEKSPEEIIEHLRAKFKDAGGETTT